MAFLGGINDINMTIKILLNHILEMHTLWKTTAPVTKAGRLHAPQIATREKGGQSPLPLPQHLAGIEQIVRIESPFDADHQFQLARFLVARHFIDLE